MIPYIDMHCDTLMKACSKRKKDIYSFPNAMLDIERLKKGGCDIQFFAIFMPPISAKKIMGPFFPKDNVYIEKTQQIFEQTVLRHPKELVLVEKNEDVMVHDGKIKGLLTLEDGRAANGQIEKLEEFYRKGIRLISLTWNHENCFGAPNSKDKKIMNTGLTTFGKEGIRRMNELGMIIDVSHLSDGGFYDVARISKKPFVASHSNCRSLCGHSRNLTDEMIKIIGEKSGVIGVNFGPEFLSERSRVSTKEAIAKHLRHLIDCGGVECAAIGTDFDGIGGKLEIGNAGQIPEMIEYLLQNGFTMNEVEHIAYKNVRRLLMDVL